MTTPHSFARSDRDLLLLMEAVLLEQGFQVEHADQGIDLLLAENRYFVIAAAAMNTINNLINAEPIAVEALASRVDSATLGPKKWDTYVVLLTQEKSGEDDQVTHDLYKINYDTALLRRIAHTGVAPTREDVERALAPFMHPKRSASEEASTDALTLLLQSLVSRGAESDLAHRAINAFRQGAVLDDIV